MRFVPRSVKRQVEKVLHRAGYVVVRGSHWRAATDRRATDGMLEHLASLGFSPGTIVDVGAHTGSFTTTAHRHFPRAAKVMFEPLKECQEHLEVVSAATGARAVYAAAASQEGVRTFHVHPYLPGSSFFLEDEDSAVNGVPRDVPSVRLDDVLQKLGLSGPFLLKADVQGGELDVLAGAESTLRDTEVVLLETSLFRTFIGGPQIADVVGWMQARGFVPHDIGGLNYRPLDGALCQVDVSFVRENGPFRKVHAFATRAQREAQHAEFTRGSESQQGRP